MPREGKGFLKTLALGEQTAFETEVPTYSHFLRVTDESLLQAMTPIKPDEVAGEAGRETDLEGRITVGGDIATNLRSEGGAWLLIKHALGSLVTTQPDPSGAPGVYQHLFTLLNELPEFGLSAKVDRDVNVFSYIGNKVQSLGFEYAMDAAFAATFGLVGRNEVTGGSVPSAAYTTQDAFLDYQGVFTMDGVEQRINSFSLTLANNLREDDFRSGSQYRNQVERAGLRDVTGTFSRKYIDDVLYNKFVNWERAALVFTFTGGVIEGGFNYELVISLPVVQFEGSTPGTGGPDMGPQDVPFTALRDAVNAREEFRLILTNAESSY